MTGHLPSGPGNCGILLALTAQEGGNIEILAFLHGRLAFFKAAYCGALQPLIKDAPDDILVYVLQQFAKVLPNDLQAKKNFLLTGGLKSIQQKSVGADPKLKIHIDDINTYYPQEIVQYFSPDYPEALFKKMEEQQGND